MIKGNITLYSELCRAKMTFKSYPKKGNSVKRAYEKREEREVEENQKK